MSMLFVIYCPVLEPEAISKEDAFGHTRTISVAALYQRYLEQIRHSRSGAENTAPAPIPDQPSQPPTMTEKAKRRFFGGLSKRSESAARSKSGGAVMKRSTAVGAQRVTSETIPDGLQSQLRDRKHSYISEEHGDDESPLSDAKVTFDDSNSSRPADGSNTDDEVLSLREVIHKILDSEGISNTTWQMTENLLYWKVTFIADSVTCDLVLNSLVTFGFGKIAGTSMSLFPSSYYSSADAPPPGSLVETPKEFDEKNEFTKSVKARLTVAQVLGAVKANACITFDFLVLIIAASFIAAMGLAENSSVQLVASMLISPMMGPTIGITFGICIKSSELWKMAVRNECIGISLCIIFGYFFGLITAVVNINGAAWGGANEWPTVEMSTRGQLRSLWVGSLTATASGLGVALSVLGGNVGSLVGVAISASILPPAVNAGVLWGHATVWAIRPPTVDYQRYQTGKLNQKSNTSCPFLLHNEYKFMYSCIASIEVLFVGCVSILLTIINIICIFIVAIGVLKIKEVAPQVDILATKTPTDVFWRSDVPMVRNLRRISHAGDLTQMAAQFSEEYKALKTEAEKKQFAAKWEQIFKNLEHDPVYSMTTQHLPANFPEIFRHLSSRNLGPLTDTAISQYRMQSEQQSGLPNPITIIQDTVKSVGNRVWNWIPFTGSTSAEQTGNKKIINLPNPFSRQAATKKVSKSDDLVETGK